MELLHLELLGSPHIRLGERPLTSFTTMKAQALLIYLAVTQRRHSRDTLASLFWQDMPDWQAKKNLRNTLPNLRALVGSHLTITRHSVAFNPASPYYLDVEVLRNTLSLPQTVTNAQALQDTIALYRDDFLATFHVRAAPTFEDWVLMEREQLRVLAIDGLLALVEQCLKHHDYQLGLTSTKRLLALDPWRETAHQQRMLLLAYSRQRGAALAQYDACCTILAEELGVEPMAETTAIYEQIKANTLPLPQAVMPLSPQPDARTNPRVDWTTFPKRRPCCGRHTELAQLHQWLVTEEACVVGIFGLGGQGKTTLVAHLARALAEDGPVRRFERIIWRSLVNAPPFTTVLQGWLTCLSDQQITRVPSHVDEQLAVLFDHLRQQRCLLVMDNVECILHHGTLGGEFRPGYEAYGQMLHQVGYREHCSSLVYISRERPEAFDTLAAGTGGVRALHLGGLSADAGEQLLHMQGISDSHEAIRTLIARYAGHPLALKLAAMTVQELFVGDLEAFLTGTPVIFGNMRQVLDQQCATLSPVEQEVLRRLATHHEPVLLPTLWDNLSPSLPQYALLEALRGLQRRSLLEIKKDGFGLPNVVTEYVMTCGRTMLCQELPEEGPRHVISDAIAQGG